MIDVKELRIGNWVRYVNRDVQVTELRHDNMITTSEHVIAGGEFFDPIPLTHELLERVGFVLDEDAGNWHEPDWKIYNNNGFCIGYKETKCCYYKPADYDLYSIYWPEVASLHSMQNLFFAFTATELVVK